MQAVTASAAQALEALGRVTLRLYINGVLQDARISNCKYNASACGGEQLSIGSACAGSVELTLAGVYTGLDNTTLRVTWDVDGTEYDLFRGKVDEAPTGGGQTAVTAYDALYDGGAVIYIPGAAVLKSCTAKDALEDIAAQLGVELDSATAQLAQAVILTEGVGGLGAECSLTNAAGTIAALLGGNAVIDRAGRLAVKRYAASGWASECYSGGASADQTDHAVTGLVFQRTDTVTETNEDGTVGERTETAEFFAGDGNGLMLVNPLATQTLTDGAFAALKGLTVRAGTFSLPGGLLLEPGDLFTVHTADGDVTAGCMGLSLTIDGGVKADVTSLGGKKTGGAVGPIQQSLQALSADLMRAKKLIADNAEINNANIQTLRAEKASVADLEVTRQLVAKVETTAQEALDAVQQAQEDLSNYASTVTNSLASLQAQIDGQIETFFYDYEPTLSNIPASEWTTETERAKHEGDLFFWKSKGYAYRFFKDGSWKWQLVQDTDITAAMAKAAQAQDTADNKRRVFVAQPVPPYDVGDLWVQGADGDIMRCQTTRSSGSYAASDWAKASKYTDDTAVTEVSKRVTTLEVSDGEIRAEVSETKALVSTLETDGRNLVLDSGAERSIRGRKEYYTLTEHGKQAARTRTLTVSFDAKADEATVIDVMLNTADTGVGLSPDVGVTTELKRYSVQLTPRDADILYIAIRSSSLVDGGSATAAVAVSNVMVETGSVATGWSPAAEDLSSQVTELRSSFTQTASEINASVSAVEKKAITSSVAQYYLSNSPTSRTGGSWQDSQPTWQEGKYIWTRNLITYGDGSTTYSPSSAGVCITGNTGADGAAGATGVGISSVEAQYYLSTSSSSATGGSWSAAVPTVTEGRYLWTRSKITYTDGTTAYTAAYNMSAAMKESVQAELSLKIGRDENDQIVSMLNASADEINIKGNRLVIESTNFKVTADGIITSKGGTVGGWELTGTTISQTHTASDGKVYKTIMANYNNDNSGSRVFYCSVDGTDTFYVHRDGKLYATNADIAGKITATSGTIGGWTVDGNRMYNSNGGVYTVFQSPASYEYVLVAGASALGSGYGSAPFYVKRDGSLMAASGTVGGWSINASRIYGGDESTGYMILQKPDASRTYTLAVGSSSLSVFTDAPFKVTKGGKLYATDAEITGKVNATSGEFRSVTIGNSTITGSSLGGTLNSAGGTFTGTHSQGALSGCNIKNSSLLLSNGSLKDIENYVGLYGSTGATMHCGDSYFISIVSGQGLCNTNFVVSGSLTVNGSKARAVATEHFGTRELDALETPTPTFADYGRARLDENGVCYIVIDPVFAETVNPDYLPTVFLTKYGQGDVWVDDEQTTHDAVVVRGTPGLAFGWETRYQQANCYQGRLRVSRFDDADRSGEYDFGGEAAVDLEHTAPNLELAAEDDLALYAMTAIDYGSAGADYYNNFERRLIA